MAGGRPTKLNKTVQTKIVKLIKMGVGVADACANVGIGERTFYDWMTSGENGDAEFAQFSQAVSRARNAAKVRAINTLHTSLGETKTVRKTVHTVTETRLNKWGQLWEYKRTDEDELTVFSPGDWRAAVEYLKRRFSDEWGDKQKIEDWRDQLLADLRAGKVVLADVIDAFGGRDALIEAFGGASLAARLFMAVGVAVDESAS